MSARRPPPETCANCGASIPPHALACPECGADERTGWRETSIYDGLDLPDSAWDEGASAETGFSDRTHRRSVSWYWLAVVVLVLVAFTLLVLGLW